MLRERTTRSARQGTGVWGGLKKIFLERWWYVSNNRFELWHHGLRAYGVSPSTYDDNQMLCWMQILQTHTVGMFVIKCLQQRSQACHGPSLLIRGLKHHPSYFGKK